MHYNFETIRKRHHTGSKKWAELLANGVREEEDIIPFSVADMEFETAPEIVAALQEMAGAHGPGLRQPYRGILGHGLPLDEDSPRLGR